VGFKLRPIRGLHQKICGLELFYIGFGYGQNRHSEGTVLQQSGVIVSNKDDLSPLFFFVQNPNDLIQKQHLRGQFYGPEELEVIKSIYQGGVFVDIGANVGNHAVFAARNLNAPKVVCFEPNPAAFAILKLNFILNNLATKLDLRMVGLSDASALLPHRASTDNLGDGRFGSVGTDGHCLEVRKADDELRNVDVGFIKIDVEGMELKVLAGLREVIGKFRPPMFVEVDMANDAEFQDFVSTNGYRVVKTCRSYSVNCNYAVISY